MRIISQDGTVDIPYDYFSLTIATGKYDDVEVANIYCHNLSSPKGTKLAEYSSKEKAEKAIEMLHNDYYDHVAEKTYHEGYYYIHTCFRFPSDEDVEV